MAFHRQHLGLTHYLWNLEDGPGYDKYLGEPSRRLFDRGNGDQVLFLINYCTQVNDAREPGEALRLEEMIANRLPLAPMSEYSVFKWIMANNL